MSDRYITERWSDVHMAYWQPIESAPTGGKPLLLFARSKNATASCIVIGWCIDGEWIECAFSPNAPMGIVPSHWMRLPGFPA